MANQAYFYFQAELNDFLPPKNWGNALPHSFDGTPSIKHLIEALGVPHPEVARLLVNGSPVDLSYRVRQGDQVEAYPISSVRSFPVEDLLSQPEFPLRFILDNHLGRLAVYLRMLGFDTLYRNNYQDEELASVAGEQKRILLTRDQRLLMRSVVILGYWVRSKLPRRQLGEVVGRFDLRAGIHPFRRCLRCNGLLKLVPKEAVLDRLEPLTRLYYDEFHTCQDCGHLYWKGTHYEHMQQMIQEVLPKEP